MRSLLIVPADNTKKIDEAMASGADAVVLDVEDSVAYENKPKARDNIRAILSQSMTKQARRSSYASTPWTRRSSTPTWWPF